ncbi:ligase-associated DNA damage response exonuclease [Olivibacter ginsenosidimutans]|uniref:Ligase-associated DNA damage response exonuclease n=1 Tax=Olivibacter ginsenosidimutans TaxID=1176537 RepID=A0ABP9C7D2_9SPHI
MLTFNDIGIYCARADLYIDPWKPVDKAIITHAHADHARFGSKQYLCHTDSVPLLKLRLGENTSVQGLSYAEPLTINGVTISLHPAGHIIGSAQVKLTYKGETWVVSGDYKLENDGIAIPFEPIRCQHFVTESTFGLPIYRFPSASLAKQDILQWIDENRQRQLNSLLIGYSLGKAQRLIEIASEAGLPLYAHGAIANIQAKLIQAGHNLHPVTYASAEAIREQKASYIVIMPPSALGSSWIKKFAPYALAYCSGWMQLRGARRRRNVNRGFVLSDHADWNQLNEAITATGAENIYVTHGYKATYAKWLRENYALNAMEVDTLYEDDLLLEEEKDEGLE